MREIAILLLGVVAGFVVQAVSGWLTDKRADDREHRAWLREKQYEVYRETTTILYEIVEYCSYERRVGNEAVALMRRYGAAAGQIMLVTRNHNVHRRSLELTELLTRVLTGTRTISTSDEVSAEAGNFIQLLRQSLLPDGGGRGALY